MGTGKIQRRLQTAAETGLACERKAYPEKRSAAAKTALKNIAAAETGPPEGRKYLSHSVKLTQK